jgi:hypothetical protein
MFGPSQKFPSRDTVPLRGGWFSLAHCKVVVFTEETSPSLARESLVSDIPAGDGKLPNLFYSVHYFFLLFGPPILSHMYTIRTVFSAEK